jgi:protein-arginine kinase activator protein McsA
MGRQFLSQEEVIERFRQAHGDRYDYSAVDYEKSDSRVRIICPDHGEFPQTPRSHWRNHGCPKCANSFSMIATHWLDSRVVFVDCDTSIIVKCKKCDRDFLTTATSLMAGHGCQNCGYIRGSIAKKQNASEQFVARAVKKHGLNYNYERAVYKGSKTKVEVGRRTCGSWFYVTPDNHLRNGKGCSTCRYRKLASTLRQKNKLRSEAADALS